jgi:lipid-binding SYLF domain-containing protein
VKRYLIPGVVTAVLTVAGSALLTGSPKVSDSKAGDQAKIRKRSEATLKKLYGLNLKSKPAIANAAGYAVFSNFGMKLLLAGGGSGSGLAVNNKTRQETFMKMVEIQAGLGIGVKKFQLVWVFETQKAFDRFIDSGWEFGGQATAAAKLGDDGGAYQGAMAIAPEVWLYQMTDQGIALELTAKGTKYYKDKDLN